MKRAQNTPSQNKESAMPASCLQKNKLKKLGFYFVLISLSVFSGYVVWQRTGSSFSASGFSDSAIYFTSARNFAAGLGLGVINPDGSFVRLTIFGPLYPFVLGLFSMSGVEPFTATRIIDMVSFAGYIFLMGYLFYRLTNSRVFSLLFALLNLSNYQLLLNFTSLLSEPLAFLFSFSGFFLTVFSVLQKNKKKLYLGGLLCGLGLLTRYAFVAFPIAGMIVILLFLDGGIKEKVLSVGKYALLGIGPLLIWSSTELLTNQSLGSRHFTLDKPFFLKTGLILEQMVDIIKYWFPYGSNLIHGVRSEAFSPILFLFFALIVLMAYMAWAVWGRHGTRYQKSPFIITTSFMVMFVIYLLIILFTNVFSTISAINDRILSPMLPLIFGIILGSLLMICQYVKVHVSVMWLYGLIITFFFVKYSSGYIQKSLSFDPYPVWRDKPIFETVRQMEIDPSAVVLSNGPDILLFYTNVYPYFLVNSNVSQKEVLLENSNLFVDERCQVYIFFPPNFIDEMQRDADPITGENISYLQSELNTVYSEDDGIILNNDYCE